MLATAKKSRPSRLRVDLASSSSVPTKALHRVCSRTSHVPVRAAAGLQRPTPCCTRMAPGPGAERAVQPVPGPGSSGTRRSHSRPRPGDASAAEFPAAARRPSTLTRLMHSAGLAWRPPLNLGRHRHRRARSPGRERSWIALRRERAGQRAKHRDARRQIRPGARAISIMSQRRRHFRQ
jgi:hypothetical protein